MLLCFQMGKKVKPHHKYHVFLHLVVQTLFSIELTGIFMDPNTEVDKQTLKYVGFLIHCMSNTANFNRW